MSNIPTPKTIWELRADAKTILWKKVLITQVVRDDVYFVAHPDGAASYNMTIAYFHRLFQPGPSPGFLWSRLNS